MNALSNEVNCRGACLFSALRISRANELRAGIEVTALRDALLKILYEALLSAVAGGEVEVEVEVEVRGESVEVVVEVEGVASTLDVENALQSDEAIFV